MEIWITIQIEEVKQMWQKDMVSAPTWEGGGGEKYSFKMETTLIPLLSHISPLLCIICPCLSHIKVSPKPLLKPHIPFSNIPTRTSATHSWFFLNSQQVLGATSEYGHLDYKKDSNLEKSSITIDILPVFLVPVWIPI